MGLADLERLLHELDCRPPTLGATRLLAIDGPAGAGKTTIARAVAGCSGRGLEDTEVQVLSLDDMYDGWAGLNPSLPHRILDQVLRPLADGRPGRWQKYDWAAGAFSAWHELAPPDLLVLEGCGAGAADLAPYTTLLVWVESPPDTADHRMLVRDGPEVLDHIAAWRRSERLHFAANRTRERADLVLAT